nr:MAG TPA: hypothetical protein [Caudoviricetes sp.]
MGGSQLRIAGSEYQMQWLYFIGIGGSATTE